MDHSSNSRFCHTRTFLSKLQNCTFLSPYCPPLPLSDCWLGFQFEHQLHPRRVMKGLANHPDSFVNNDSGHAHTHVKCVVQCRCSAAPVSIRMWNVWSSSCCFGVQCFKVYSQIQVYRGNMWITIKQYS